MIILYDINKKKLVIEEAANAIDKLYYLEGEIPTKEIIENYIEKTDSKDEIKKYFEKYGIRKGILLMVRVIVNLFKSGKYFANLNGYINML